MGSLVRICTVLFGQIPYRPQHEKKTCLRGFENNKGTDQPALPGSLVSAFAILLLKNIISDLASSGISQFKLVSVAEAGFWYGLIGNPEVRFSRIGAHMPCMFDLLS